MFKNTLFFKPVKRELILGFIDRLHSEFNANKIGYYHLPDTMMPIIEEGIEFKSKCKKIKDVIIVGIGGSSLGTKAVYSMLKDKSRSAKLHFLENLDPKSATKLLKKVNLKNSMFFIVSKSGTTLETISLTKIIIKELDINLQSKDFSDHFAVITDPDSPLEKFGKKYKLPVFNIPKNVGGRFSVFSAASLIPLTICGFDTKALLEGAKQSRVDYLDKDNDTILQKAYRYAIDTNANINVVFSYGDSFKEFNAWYVQLWAESLGKKKGYSRIGLTPVGLIGSTDQHSFLQLIMEGPKDKTVTFIKQLRSLNDVQIPALSLDIPNSNLSNNINMQELLNMQCDATMQSIKSEGVATDIIEIEILDAWHVGYLMYYYKLLTSVCGIMLGINTYNQPGVEVGKQILTAMLKAKNS